MKNNANKILFLFLLLILSIGAVSAADDIADDLSVDSFSISETDGAVSHNLEEVQSTNVDYDDDSKDADASDILASTDDKKDYINGSAVKNTDLLGSEDDEQNGKLGEDEPYTIYVSLDGDDEDGDGSQDSPFKTIQRAIDDAWPGDRILISEGVYDGEGNVGFNIEDLDGLIIEANGPVTISGADTGESSLLSIFSDNVQIIGITFADCKGDNGMYIYAEGVKIIDCTFDNVEAYWSIIQFYSDYGEITSCNFVNSCCGDNVITLDGREIKIKECYFSNLETDWYIVSIYMDDEYYGSFNKGIIDSCNFYDLSMNDNIIYLEGNEIEINGCNFTDIETYHSLIKLYSSDGKITSCNFENSDSNEEDGYTDDLIYLEGDNIEIDDCTFTEVTASNYIINMNSNGGYIGSSDFSNIESGNDGLHLSGEGITVEDCTFSDLKSSQSIIKLESKYGAITSSTFENNEAENGRNVHITGTENLISDCEFENNNAQDGADLYIGGSDCTVERCNFTNTGINGNALYIGGESAKIKASTFTDNSALNGGAIYIDNDYAVVNNCYFINNGASQKGGAIYNDGYLTQIYDSEFTDNNAANGGAIYSNYHATDIHDCNFTSNIASYGGAINIMESSTIKNCNFDGNNATMDGGAIYVQKSEVTVDECSFTDNTASRKGGAVYINNYGNNTVSNSDFISNSAENGGAIYNDGTDSIITNNEFDKNSASANGGSIYNEGSISELSGNTISNSNAEVGKSIYNYGNINEVTVIIADNSTVTPEPGQAAKISVKVTDDNGNIISGKTVTIYADGEKLTSVTASDDLEIIVDPIHEGEVIVTGKYSSAHTTISKGCTIIFTEPPYFGPIYVSTEGNDENKGSPDKPVRTIEKAIQLATRDGNEHAVFINEGTYYVNNLVIAKNQALNITGLGSVTIDGNQTRTLTVKADYTNISNINFVNGKDDYFAPIYVYSDYITYVSFDNCSFINNTGITGGAMFVWCANATINNCRFINNTGDIGGAIYIKGGNVFNPYEREGIVLPPAPTKLTNCEFDNNRANQYGGSVYCNGENTTLANNTIVNSDAPKGKEIYTDNSIVGYKVVVLNNGTATCLPTKTVTVPIKVTDDMGNEITGNYLDVILNGETLLSDIYVSEGMASVAVNPPKGNSTVSVEYPGYGIIYTGTILSDHNPYTGVIYVAENGHDDNEGSVKHAVKSLKKAMELATASTNPVHEIWLRGGTYDVSDFVINKPVTIRAYNGETVIINGNGNQIFEITSDDVTLAGISFINSTENAITINANNTHIYNGKFDDAAIQTASYAPIHDTLIEGCSFSNTGSGSFYGDGLTIRNCNYTNVSSNSDGGALCIEATNALVDNCIFDNCSSTSYGGAISSSKDNIAISNSKFLNVHSDSNGGAMRLSGDNPSVVNCTFSNVTSKSFAGAINLANSEGGIIDNCTFEDVKSGLYAGAIYANNKNAVINDCSFNNVESKAYGGAIAGTKDNLTVSNCNFTNTHSNSNGGAIYMEGKDSKVTDCNFNDTSANNGGSIYINGDDSTIENCNFTESEAAANGGAIYIFGDDSSIDDCAFSDIKAANNGGSIYIRGSNSQIDDCDFTDAHADVDGGAIYASGADNRITDCSFNGTDADNNGGSIYLTGESSLIDNCDFADGSAYKGGSIYVDSPNTNITDCDFTNVTSQAHGGAVFINKEDVTVDDCSFSDVHSDGQGGAIFSPAYNTVVKNSNFTDTSAGEIGGAVLMTGEDSHIENSSFTNTRSNGNGGAVFMTGEDSSIRTSSFTNTRSDVDGGSVYMSGKNSSVEDSSFTNATAANKGGAICVDGDESNINDCDFSDTSAKEGGAIYINREDVHVDDCDFTDSNANDGGAIFAKGKNSHISNSNFTDMNANGYGGAIYIDGENGNVNGCDFTDVSAEEAGGAIYIYGKNANIDDCDFTNTVSKNLDGGAICIDGANANINDCDFANTYSGGAGGAIDSMAENTNINGCTFTNSSANDCGGAIRLYEVNSGSVSNCDFTETKAFSGSSIFVMANNVALENITSQNSNSKEWGAIAFQRLLVVTEEGYAYPKYSHNATLNNVTVSDSVSTELAGGIYLGGDNIILNNSKVTNSKSYMGGGIYWNGDNGIMDNTEVSSNNAKSGAGVFWIGNNGTVNNSNITDNHATHSFGGIAYSSKLMGANNIIKRNTPSDEDDYSTMPDKKSITAYESYFIPMSDGSIGFCINPDRMRADEHDIFLVYQTDSVRKLRASPTTQSNLIINNNKNKQNVAEYMKILYYLYYNEVSNATLKEAYLVFIDGDYENSNNPLVMDVIHQYTDNNLRVNDTGDKRIVVVNGQKEIWEYSFASWVNTQPTKQNLLSVTVSPTPVVYNLTVEKITLTPKVPVGNQTKFTIKVTNNGNWETQNINVTELSYEGLVYDSFIADGSWTFIGSKDNPKWNYAGKLDVGESIELTVIFNTTKPGNFTNVVTANDENTTGKGNNTTQVLKYGIKVEKITLDSDVPVGDQVKFIIRVTNTGEIDLTDVNVTEAKYDGLTYADYEDSDNMWDFIGTQDKPVWRLKDTLGIGETAEFIAIFNTTVAGNFTNTVTAGNNKTNDTGNNTTEVHNIGIKVEKITLTPDVPVGDQVRFIIRVTNTGDWDLNDVNVTEAKYEGLIYDDYEDPEEMWEFIGTRDKPVWRFKDTLEIGKIVEFTVIFNTTVAGNFTNIVTAGNNKTNDTGNNTTKVHNLGIKVEKIALTPHVPVGAQTSFTIRVTNTGDWNLTNVNVTEVKYDGLTYDGFNDPTGKWILQRNSAKPMWIYNGILGIGESAEFTVTFNATEKGNFTNIVTAGNDRTNDTGNNTTVVHPYGMKVEKISLTKVVSVGMPAYFLINVTNTGEWELKNVNVTEINSEGLSYQGFVDPTGKWVFTGTMEHPSWEYTETLPVGNSTELIVYYKTLRAGNFTNVVTVGDNESESKAEDNDTIIIKNPEFKVEKITLTPRVYLGELASFLIKVTNTGDCDLGEVYVKELSYDGMVYDHFTDRSGIWEFDGKDKWTYKFPIAPNETVQFTVFFKTVKVGQLTNVVVSGTNETNETTANNVTEVYVNNTDKNNTDHDKKKHNGHKHGKHHSSDDKGKVNGHFKSSASVKSSAEESTGNPLLALLVSIMALFVSTRYRRR